MPPNSAESVCAICRTGNEIKACSGCGKVYYCSSDHQKEHWKVHKSECVAYKVVTTATSKHMEATRDIKAGSLILSEAPLVIGPDWSYSLFDTASTLNCVGCFEPIKVLNFRCPRCSWPCCNVNCIGLQNSKLHELECAFLKCGLGVKNPTDFGALRSYYRSDVLLAMKCLLLQLRSKKKFAELMELNGHVEERKGGDDYRGAEKHIDYLEENFLKPLKEAEANAGRTLLPQKDRKTLRKIYGIIDTNAMYLTSNNEIAGLFMLGSTVSHSCVPNTKFAFDKRNGFKLSIRAVCDIKKGERVTTCWTNILAGTHTRKQQLQANKFTGCDCARCSDPSELGTHFSSLRCIGVDDGEACDGIQVPTRKSDRSEVEWTCNKCPARVSGVEIADLMAKMGNEIDNTMSTEATVPVIESLVDKLSHFLHPNHFHLFTLKHALAQLYGNHRDFAFETLSVANLKRKVRICEELLAIIEKLDPHCVRLALYVAVILYEKFNGARELLKRKCSDFKWTKADGLKALQRANSVLTYELDTPQGKELSKRIEDAIESWQKE